MTFRVLCAAALASSLAAAACSRPAPSASALAPAIALRTPAQDGGTAYVEVTGLDEATLDSLGDATYTADQWSELLRVSVSADAPPVMGNYAIDDNALRFTPLFPFDPGRQYEVRFDPAHLPEEGSLAAPLVATVGRPASQAVPSTVVERVYPTGEVVPENHLRMYIHFSAPMGRRSGIEYLQLLDERGQVVQDPFLPLEYEFWNPERTRFTVFFDPGRVKLGILPNETMGRPLTAGHSYTLAINQDWRDANRLPLKEPFRRTFRVGPEDKRPLDTATWRIEPPKAGGRGPLVVSFPEPLDHGLLLRSLGVRQGGQALEGDMQVAAGEKRWMFTPREAWRTGMYELIALSILEDLAGNQIGRAFEVDAFDEVDRDSEPKTMTVAFRIQ